MSLLASIAVATTLWAPAATAAPETLSQAESASFADIPGSDGAVELAQRDDDRRYGRGFDTPIGALSVLRVGASAFAAVVVFAVLSWPLRRPGRPGNGDDGARRGAPLLPNVAARVAASVAVFVVALLVLAE